MTADSAVPVKTFEAKCGAGSLTMGGQAEVETRMNRIMPLTRRETIEATLSGVVLFAFLAALAMASQRLGI
jgi:hypothetical protein